MKTALIIASWLLTFSALAKTSYTCEERRSGNVYLIEVSQKASQASMVVFSGGTPMSGLLAMIQTTSKKLKPLIDNDIPSVKGLVITEKSTTATFKIDGADFQGRPRFGIQISSPKGEFTLSSCSHKIPGIVTF